MGYGRVMKKQFIKVKTDGMSNLTKGKIYPVLSNDIWDMALVFLFIDDAGKIVHRHDWEDYWEDNFEIIEEEMTEREVMIYNSGISNGLWLASSSVDQEYRSELFERKQLKKEKKDNGYLWLDDGIQGIVNTLDDLYNSETDHFRSHDDKDQVV